MIADEFLLLIAGAAAAGIAYKAWHDALGARELANRIAKEACARTAVQFLDDTVAFAGLRLARDARGRRRILRTYTFDYTRDGTERSQGFVVIRGEQLESIGFAGLPS